MFCFQHAILTKSLQLPASICRFIVFRVKKIDFVDFPCHVMFIVKFLTDGKFTYISPINPFELYLFS